MKDFSTHKWQELSGPEVAALAQETDVAILPVGCIEMHGPHLPTGTDGFQAEGMAEMIAERERAIVMPTLFLNINDEMKAYPGTIAISPELMVQLYEELVREAARNGFRRVLLLIAHGGSQDVTRFLHHSFLHRELQEELGVCLFELFFYPFVRESRLLETPPAKNGHGCEMETSFVMRFRPELVHLERLAALPEGEGVYEPKSVDHAWYVIDWSRQVPRGYIGCPQLATAEKGRRMAALAADACADVVRQIKRYDPISER